MVFYFLCFFNLEWDFNFFVRIVVVFFCGGRRIVIKYNNDDIKKENKNKRIKSCGNFL